MRLVQYLREHWDDDDFWTAAGDYAAVYGTCGLIAFAAGLILAGIFM